MQLCFFFCCIFLCFIPQIWWIQWGNCTISEIIDKEGLKRFHPVLKSRVCILFLNMNHFPQFVYLSARWRTKDRAACERLPGSMAESATLCTAGANSSSSAWLSCWAPSACRRQSVETMRTLIPTAEMKRQDLHQALNPYSKFLLHRSLLRNLISIPEPAQTGLLHPSWCRLDFCLLDSINISGLRDTEIEQAFLPGGRCKTCRFQGCGEKNEWRRCNKGFIIRIWLH